MKKCWNPKNLERFLNHDQKRWELPPPPKAERTGRIEAIYYDAYGQKVGEDKGTASLLGSRDSLNFGV